LGGGGRGKLTVGVGGEGQKRGHFIPGKCPKVRLSSSHPKKSLNKIFLDGALVGAGSLRRLLSYI